ncbi:uncharacterized protein TrAFT101_002164 [Trichoderma asperellum]|uniref:uncharacterized protein n=1 Tax=Trichoderma asperellum TaxID=101201 RepID=UPI0033295FA0|nr:hypothetical protein TrAFT101_002164 [Trichoderma asperellum]
METSSVTVAADLSAKIIVLCSKFVIDVANARAEIERLKEQLKNLETTLRHANHLLEQPNSQFLSASRELDDPLQRCQAELQRLQDKLEPSATRKAMRRFGLRAVKWPFNKGEVEVVIASLVGYREAITAILQIDQTKLLLDINGRIENLSLRSVENRSKDCKPHFMIPFPRDPDFVDRPVLREWLEEQYNTNPARRIALVGMGGFGKSQIVIEFAYRLHIASPETSVFWVHGGTEAKFEESYRLLADTLTLPGRHDPNANVLALVRDWLQKTEALPWLIILDNADEMERFFPSRSENGESQREPLASFLPRTGNGKIVIMSRNRSVAEKLTGSHKAIQEVPTMCSLEALKILENKLSQDIDQDAAIDLACALDFIPLAVNQAAAYINRRAPRVSISSYLDELRQNEKQKKSLLNRDFGDLRRREDVSNSVVITWQVTFEQIRQERPTAANLLLLMSFFQPQDIPEFMLSDYNIVTSDFEDMNGDNDEDLEDDLDVLRGYSLIRLSTTSGLCDMHALVQFCTKVWLSEFNGNNFARLKSLFLSLCAEHFPSGNFETWARCQLLLPHMKSFLHEEPTDAPDTHNWIKLLAKVSVYLLGIGDHFAAERVARKAFQSRKRRPADKNPFMFVNMMILLATYILQGRLEDAEPLRVQLVETSKRILGDEHLGTLRIMSDLSFMYKRQGRCVEAKLLAGEVMEALKRVSGDEHLETLISTPGMASVYTRQGRLAEVELILMQGIEIKKRVLGGKHPDVLRVMAELAHMFRNQGRLREAEPFAVKVMETRKEVLGDEHPDVLDAMAELARIFRDQRRLTEAESLFMQVIETRKKILGDEHPDVFDAIIELVCIFRNQRRLTEAESLYVQVMETMKRVLGDEHVEVLGAMLELALIFTD